LGNQFGEHPDRREVAFIGDFAEDLPILLLPKEFSPVGMEAEGLMELKIEADERHIHLAVIENYGNQYPMRIYSGSSGEKQCLIL
jgi:hypothetical protein